MQAQRMATRVAIISLLISFPSLAQQQNGDYLDHVSWEVDQHPAFYRDLSLPKIGRNTFIATTGVDDPDWHWRNPVDNTSGDTKWAVVYLQPDHRKWVVRTNCTADSGKAALTCGFNAGDFPSGANEQAEVTTIHTYGPIIQPDGFGNKISVTMRNVPWDGGVPTFWVTPDP